MVYLELLGFIAGFFSMIAFVPQVYKTWKMKSAKGVSIHMFIIYNISNTLWSVYGFAFNKPAIYITNLVMLVLALTQIILKIKYDKQENKNFKI
jgi:MtN3 and saliva related transmembrane protein